MATYLLSLLFALAATCAQAATYYWKGGSSWADYGTLSNWSTEGYDGADADALPGSSDSFESSTTGKKYYLDLGGQVWETGVYSPHSGHEHHFTNGTFKITKNSSPKGVYTYVHDGAKYTCSSGVTFTLGCWDANPLTEVVYSGGEIDYSPADSINAHNWHLTVNAGGTARLCKKWSDGLARTHNIQNSGTLYLSDGFLARQNNASVKFNFTQHSGTLVLGGAFSNTGYANELNLTLSGGTLAIRDGASFSATSVSVAPDASVTIEIPADSTVDLTPVSFSAGAAITKTGAGDFDYMIGNMPDSLAVKEGALALKTADTTYDLSAVTFTASTSLKLAASGIVLSASDSSVANATFTFADGFTPASGATVFTCSDATVLTQAQTGLNASLAGTGMTVEISGNSLVAESHYTFNSASVTDMNDTAGWVNGIAAPAGQPAIVSGPSTDAVMDGNVPAYSTISVEDGAALTVTATRGLPATTLAAGTALKVAATEGSVVMETCNSSGYVMDTDTLVGTMSPSRGLSEITDIVGIRGGGWFGERSNPYTYVNVKVLDDGARLHTQFIYNDSDYTKCAFVDFTKDEHGNIYAKGVGAGYISPTSDTVDFDEIEYTAAPYGTSNTSGAYGVKNLSFKAPVSHGGPSTVTAVGDVTTTGSGSVMVDVAEDCVLDLSSVDVTTAATLVKTGDGTVVFGDELPTALNVTEGVLVLQPYVEYDMVAITVAGGVETKVVVDGEYKDAVAFVQQNGNTVFMSSGVYVGVGTWDTAANWVNSEMPDDSTAVHIHGADTVLTIDDASVTMPASISVEGGATLKVLADVTLPPLAIDATSKVVFGDNETQPVVAATLDASLTTACDTAATPVTLSVVEVATNAVLNVASGMKFKNVDFRLYGTITKSDVADVTPVFGYAENGETSYIAFTVDGGVFAFHSSQNADRASVSVACPASGGTVIPVRDILIRNASRPVTGWQDFGRWEYGRRNPIDIPFNVVVDGTHMDCAAEFYASGAVHISLVNGARIQRQSSCLGHGFNMALQDAATVSVGEGCSITFTTGDGSFAVDSQSAVDTVVVHNGGRYTVTYNTSGFARGTFVSDGGIVGVDKLRTPSGSSTPRAPRSNLLQGFGSVRLDGDLSMLSYNSGSGNFDWDRHVTMSNIPFIGAGSVTVTNGVPAYPFTVTMVNGANTATGSIKVAKVEGDAETALYFADGANWAGTVVAGNVALTNLTDGAATATFGTLDLAADFNIRVWTENGVIVTNDMVNVGEYQSHGGRLSMEPMTEGLEFAAGDKIVVGKIAKASPNPAVKAGWCVKRLPIDGDDANELLVAKKGIGLQVILR